MSIGRVFNPSGSARKKHLLMSGDRIEIDLPFTEQRGCHGEPMYKRRAIARAFRHQRRGTPRDAAHSPPIGRD
jgi:hypothetical protein